MAELAAGAVVAEQVISTGLEAGAAVSIAKPTQPLKATLSQIATAPANDSSLALARSHHTVTTINSKAYIFGGLHGPKTLCNTDVHALSLPTTTTPGAPEYACYPAFPLKDTYTGTLLVPAPRHSHAACAYNSLLAVHGGSSSSSSSSNDTPIDEHACIWLFDTDTLRWSKCDPSPDSPRPSPRANHSLFLLPRAKAVVSAATDPDPDPVFLLHGGGGQGPAAAETWIFSLSTARWTQLPSAPAPSASAAFIDGALYSISATTSALHGAVHVLPFGATPTWQTIEFPINPLAAPGPKARLGAALVPLSTGYGRHYLVYMLGRVAVREAVASAAKDHPLCSDVWALQVPSRGFNAAAVKDVIRDKVLPASVESGAYSWAEVEIVPTEQVAREGKVHPGPRAFVGASECLGGKGVIFWGGEMAGGECESDGWLLKIE